MVIKSAKLFLLLSIYLTTRTHAHTHTHTHTHTIKVRVSKGAKVRNRYNQVQHMTQNNNEKVTNSQVDITYESQEVSPFPAGDHKAHINRRA